MEYFRDVITIDKNETDFLKVLRVVKNQLQEYYTDDIISTCITGIVLQLFLLFKFCDYINNFKHMHISSVTLLDCSAWSMGHR